MLLLSRIIVRGSLKHFTQNPTFAIKERFSSGAIALKCYCQPAYLCRPKLIFHVSSEPTRPCSSFTPHKRELSSDENANTPENEVEVDMKALAGGDPELEKRIKILLLEREVMKQEGCRVPTHMDTAEWEELLKLTSRASRRKFMNYLFIIEKKKESRKKKKEERRSLAESDKSDSDTCDTSGGITYGFRGSTIFVRVYDATMNSFYNYNAIRAMMFGQKLVFDCSYDSHMTPRESINCAKQLMIAFAENRLHPEPFDLYLTGGQSDCRTLTGLNKFIPTMYDDTFPLTLTEKSYLELFPKENLVYLTPHCREELLEFDHDAVYVIGAMVDKVNNEPLSLAKAKREGLRMAKLPLDRYLDWGSGGSKTLTLNQMLQILLSQKHTGDWRKSLTHVPQRKLVRENQTVKPFKQHFRHNKINVKNLLY